jgi:glutamate-1-semialdehyde 2,1-aminomutase
MPITATLDDLVADLESAYRAATPRSQALHTRAAGVMPGGDTRTGTFHLPWPIVMARGQGSRLWDEDGREYIDFLSNFTSLIHGHAHPVVTAAIVRQASLGTAHGSPTALMTELAERIQSRFASVERIRFCNSGTESALFAIRAARAFTGRSLIVKMEGGYHGSYDHVQVAQGPDNAPGLSPAAVAEVVPIPFNDSGRAADVFAKRGREIAAVIIEPMMMSGGCLPAEPEFIRTLARLARDAGALFICDEVATFRLGYGGAQEVYGLEPDLTTFGKVIGGGLPVGAFGGRADVMAVYDPTKKGTVAHSGTYNGNAITMAAGIATLDILTREAIDRLNGEGDALRGRVGDACKATGLPLSVTGMGSLIGIHPVAGPVTNAAEAAAGDRRVLRAVHLSLLSRGIFSAARQFYVLSTAMNGADTDAFMSAFTESINQVAAAARGEA